MAFELKQSLRLSQSLVMTPQLQQAIKLLQLNRMEMIEMINQELVENPVLDEGEISESTDADVDQGEYSEDGITPEAEQKRDEEAFEKPKDSTEEVVTGKEDDINWEQYIEDFSSSPAPAPAMKESLEDLPSFENALTKTTSLEEHLNWQISMMSLMEKERKLAQAIIGNLNEDGYLQASMEEMNKDIDLDAEDAEEILKMIQNLDPVGVAARNVMECLLVQAKFMKPRDPLVEKIIENHLPELERKNFAAISKSLKVPVPEISSAVRIITEFEPKPGRLFNTTDAQYITPDIFVFKMNNEFVVLLNEDGMPKLKISNYYKEILRNSKGKGGETREYVQDKLKSAMWLIRSIHNRQKTIFRVTEAIVVRQKDFFDRGVSELKPMILKDIASDVGMHESTISRVTTNKYVHTPVGIFELKYFFNSGINASDGGDSLASETVKQKIKQIISKEDSKNPISDQKLVELLKSENIDIARRTVAKYREMMGILSSAKRKKMF